MSDGATSQPRAWLCKHCGERVDPTMDLCWNCGRDKQGELDPADFVNQVDVDLSRCSACDYSLKGNEDAKCCPECGEPVPWVNCERCGVRGSRAEMAEACPACKIAETGVGFESEVTLLGVAGADGLCRQCEYDMRGLADAQSCPECGYMPQGEQYDTAIASARSEAERIAIKRRKRYQQKRVLVLLALIGPGCLVMGFVLGPLLDSDQSELATVVTVLWIVSILVALVETVRSLGVDLDSFID